MRIGLIASAIFHLIIAAWVLRGFAAGPAPEQVEAIPVELVQTEAPKEAKTPEKLAELRLPKLDDKTDASAASGSKSDEAAPAEHKADAAADKPETAAPSEKAKPAQEEAGKPPPDPPAPAGPQENPSDAAPALPPDVLKAAPSIGGVPQLSPAEVAVLVNGGIDKGDAGGVVTSSVPGGLPEAQVTAVRAQAQKCWRPPSGWSSGRRANVTIRFRLNRDGSVNGTPVTIEGPASPLGKAAADKAVLAVKRCGPYQLPAESYDKWQVLELHFALGG
jgi:hypothetical protein